MAGLCQLEQCGLFPLFVTFFNSEASLTRFVFFYFLRRLKTYLAKVAKNAQKSRVRHLSRPRRPFWGPLAAILDFAGGAALQVVSEGPLRR